MKKIAILVGVLVLAYLFFFRKKEEGENKEGDTTGTGGVKPPPDKVEQPPVVTTGTSTAAQTLDPLTGQGFAAIQSRAKSLYNSSEADVILRRAVKADYFDVFSKYPKVRAIIENIALAGKTTAYEIALVPSFFSPAFSQQLQELISATVTRKVKTDLASIGREAEMKKLATLADFTQVSNFRLLPLDMIHDIIDKPSSFGQCKGSQSMKHECQKGNIVKTADGINLIANKINSELVKYEKALLQQAQTDLMNAGWKFL